jgi:hypothetical protein
MAGRPAVVASDTWMYSLSRYEPFEAQLVPVEPDSYFEKSCYEVHLDGIYIGRVFQQEFTRERSGKGLNYVFSRWQSWGWTWRLASKYRASLEASTRKSAVEHLVREWRERQ